MNAFYATVCKTGSTRTCLELRARDSERLLETLDIVPATQDHRSYIISTWVRSYNAQARRMVVSIGLSGHAKLDTSEYGPGESKVAERNWERCHVVTSPGNPFTIHAWVCADEHRLWHVYVPPELRGHGVARALVEHYAGTDYRVSKPWPRTPSGHRVLWNPYLNVETFNV